MYTVHACGEQLTTLIRLKHTRKCDILGFPLTLSSTRTHTTFSVVLSSTSSIDVRCVELDMNSSLAFCHNCRHTASLFFASHVHCAKSFSSYTTHAQFTCACAFSKCQGKPLLRESHLLLKMTDGDLQRNQIRLMEERILQFEQRLDALEDAVTEMNLYIAEGAGW